MDQFTLTALYSLSGTLLLIFGNVAIFNWFLRSFRIESISDQQLPKATVVLSVRGNDPSLSHCVQALLKQNYPHYSLRIIVDGQDDFAWSVIHQAVHAVAHPVAHPIIYPATHPVSSSAPSDSCPARSLMQVASVPSVQVSPLQSYYETCSLKCSAILQAISDLDDSDEIVVIVDADVISHPTWLRELIKPLVEDSRIGITSGIRWYMSSDAQWGSLARYLWNSASFIMMYVVRIPWGGSIAIRRSLIENGIADLWRHSLADDAPLTQKAHQLGWQMKFVPAAVMINQEECDWAACWRFVSRQLLVTRLYHWGWIVIFTQAIVLASELSLLLVALLKALVQAQFTSAIWLGTGLLSYVLAFAIGQVVLEQSIQHIVHSRGDAVSSPSWVAIGKMLVIIPVITVVNALYSLWVLVWRKVVWRGITYTIQAQNQIQLQAYHPYQPTSVASEDDRASIL